MGRRPGCVRSICDDRVAAQSPPICLCNSHNSDDDSDCPGRDLIHEADLTSGRQNSISVTETRSPMWPLAAHLPFPDAQTAWTEPNSPNRGSIRFRPAESGWISQFSRKFPHLSGNLDADGLGRDGVHRPPAGRVCNNRDVRANLATLGRHSVLRDRVFFRRLR
jgi:hypothetical protein